MIFEIKHDTISSLDTTTFSAAGLRERDDLQRLLRDHIDVVSADTLVLAEEFGEWSDSRRRIDLLAVDKDANLVVFELKRTEDGGHMELQALRYAAMVSTLTAERAIEVFGSYLKSRDKDDDPEQALLEFLEWDEIDEDQFAQDVRVVLVSADFSRELTTTVMWLNEKDMDIRCVRMQPHCYEGRTFVDVQQVIPLPEANDYQVQVREKKRQERRSRSAGRGKRPFDIRIDGTTYPGEWKRNAALIIAKHLVRRGVSPEEITEVTASRQHRLWRSIEGETSDPEVFNKKAAIADAEAGRKYDARRWHTSEGDLIIHAGRTYALTNQWGGGWTDRMERIKARYPEVELEWSPSES